MAEQVQFRLEAQVPELEDLERKGLFSPREIRAIVKRRTRLEYALERRISRKEDYLRYIEYEVNLEALRRARKDKLFVGKTYKLSLSDYSGLRRIQNVFDRATRTFAGDTTLWLQYLKWAIDNNRKKTVMSVFSRAIQKLPTNPTLWVLAANHELNVNKNTTAARGLFQRGLRLCDDSQELWAAYHLMEVEYTEKIRERRKVLGIGAEQRKQNNESFKKAEDAEDPGEGDAFEGDVIKLPELLHGEVAAFREDDDVEQPAKKRRRTEGELVTDVAEALSNEDGSNPFLNGAVARVVYNAAIGKIPSDLEFRKRLLKNYAPFVPESPAAEAGREEVYESLRRDFSDSADARGLVARRHLMGRKPGTLEWLAAVRETSAEFAQAVKDVDTPEMHDVRCAFLRDVLEEGRKEPAARTYLSKMLSKAYGEAFKSGKASSDLVSRHVDFTDRILKDRTKALTLATRAAESDEHSKSPKVWLALAAVSKNWKEALEKGLARIPESDVLWEEYFDKLEDRWEAGQVDGEEVIEKYKSALGLSSTLRKAALRERLMIGYLDFTLRNPDAVHKARKLARELALRSMPTAGFWKRCMEVEEEVRANAQEDRARRQSFSHSAWLSERLLGSSKADADAWARSAKVHIQAGEYAKAAAVCDRARAALSGGTWEEFEMLYAAMVTGQTKDA